MKTLRFLIVEDDEFQRLMLEKALRLAGAETICAVANGALAIQTLRDRANGIDIVITDLMMPDVDGIELIEWLLASGHPAQVILMSAAEQALSAAAAIAEGNGMCVLGAITKPITPEKIKAVLGPYLARAAR